MLDAKPKNRAKLVEWTLEGATGELLTEDLNGLFRNAWNGMRSLPFSNAQIAAAFSAIAGLVSVGFRASPQSEDDRQRFSTVRGDALLVEFAYANYATSRGYSTKESMRRAMRGDFQSLVSPKYHNRLEEVKNILQLIQNPTMLFEFESLVEIFARDLIPSQVVLGRNPTLFNPAAITIFGLP